MDVYANLRNALLHRAACRAVARFDLGATYEALGEWEIAASHFQEAARLNR